MDERFGPDHLLRSTLRVSCMCNKESLLQRHQKTVSKVKILESPCFVILRCNFLSVIQNRICAETLLLLFSYFAAIVSVIGSDDATTCHLVVLRHTGNYFF